jgi:hypothetical protein
MKEGKSLLDLAQELTRQHDSKRDFRTPTKDLTMVVNGINVTDDPDLELKGVGMFGIRDTAHAQLASHLKIPKEYYDRMRATKPALLAENVNEWLHATNETRLVRTLDGQARAFLSPRYRMIDNFDVASAALPAIQKAGCQVVSADVTDSRLYVSATTPKMQARIDAARANHPGSHSKPTEKIVVQMGITLSNSEIGYGSVRIEPLLFILACLNGAIVQDMAVRKFHIGRNTGSADEAYEVFKDDTIRADDQAFMLKMRDAVDAAFEEAKFQSIVERAQASTENRLEISAKAPISKVVEVTARSLKTTGDEANSIVSWLMRGNDLSQWGLSNAVTRMAQDVDSYDRSIELSRLGGDILNMPEPAWQKFSEEVAAVAA